MNQFIMNNLALVAIFIISGIMLAWPEILKLIGSSREVGTFETTRLMNTGNALVLDVRDNSEFSTGRIPKSKNIPLAEIEKRVDEIAKFKDKPVIVACKTGTRSTAAIKTLKALGFADVYQLQGGFPTWQQASLPVEK